jgi:hypothetical protein
MMVTSPQDPQGQKEGNDMTNADQPWLNWRKNYKACWDIREEDGKFVVYHEGQKTYIVTNTLEEAVTEMGQCT